VPNVDHSRELREQIQLRLNKFNRTGSASDQLTPAAVVVGVSVIDDSSSACILLTQRSNKLRKHAGQFALPGGKVDKDESIVEAALRELQEELGLQQSENSVLGLLDDMPTHSGFNITPVVVWIDDLNSLKANPDEVTAVYQVPLAELASIDLNLSHEREESDILPGQNVENNTAATEHDVMSLYLPSVGTTIYSPTAAIMYQFREVALLGRTTRVAHFGQPRFAWR